MATQTKTEKPQIEAPLCPDCMIPMKLESPIKDGDQSARFVCHNCGKQKTMDLN